MKFLAIIRNNAFHFESDYTRAAFMDFCRKYEGSVVEIVPRQKISREARGYFEGAIVPSYCEWAEGLDPLNHRDCSMVREMLKQEFNGAFVRGIKGNPVKVSRSTKYMTKTEFRNFIDHITDYFLKQQIPIPNPDLYKKWRDELSFDEPTLTFWEYLRKYGIECDGTQFPQKQVAKKKKNV